MPASGPVLSAADMALCVFGPWDARAQVEETSPGVLWHPRVATARLERLLTEHGATIRAAAAAAGVEEPWIVSRLRFVRMLHRDDDLK